MAINDSNHELRARLQALLAGVGQLLTTREREQVAEFIDVNEFGVALETLIGYLVESRHLVPRRIAEDAKRLADDMDLGCEFLGGLTIRTSDDPEPC